MSEQETIIYQFEQAFDSSGPSRIDEFLTDFSGNRDDLLTELIHIELELRLKAGQAARVEQYQRRYPDTLDLKDRRIELLRTELGVRSRYETALDFQEYILRFPDDYQHLLDILNPQKKEDVDIRELIDQIELDYTHSFSDSDSRFRRIEMVQQGGLGNIWRAEDRELGREVAVKEIKDKFADDPEHQVRFENEAILTGALEHPGIVPVYGMGRFSNQRPYYAMRLIRGDSLQVAIQQYHQSENQTERSLKFRRLIQIFLNLCDAIEFAHDRGVIHRDIKPSNLMVGTHGEAVVVDWGLAVVFNASHFPASAQLKQLPDDRDHVVGSPAFMSPEQAGERSGEISVRSDVYSLGATLLSIVTGNKNPNSSVRVDEAEEIGFENVQVERNLRPLLSICQKAMSPKPDSRYRSASELAKEVECFLIDEPVAAHRSSPLEFASRLSRKYRGILNTALVSALGIAIIAIVASLMINQSRLSEIKAKQDALDANRLVQLEKEKVERILEDTRKGFEAFAGLFSEPGACGLGVNLTLLDGLNQLRSKIDDMPESVQAMMYNVSAMNHHGALKFREAKKDYDLAIKIADQYYSENNILSMECRAGRVVLMQQAGAYGEAFEESQRLLEIFKADPKRFENQSYMVRSVLAMCHLANGKPNLAMQLQEHVYKEALEIFKDPSEQHCLKIQALKIGILRHMKRVDEADELCESMIDLVEKSGQGRSPVAVRLLTERARIQILRSELSPTNEVSLESILKPLNEALVLQTKLLGSEHLNARMIELEIARARYQHSRATINEVGDSVKKISELAADFKKRFSHASRHIQRINKYWAEATRTSFRMTSNAQKLQSCIGMF